MTDDGNRRAAADRDRAAADVKAAAGVVIDIAAALGDLGPTLEDPSLATGEAGLALFHAYTGDEQRAVACLERAVAGIRSQATGPSLAGGYAGVAWVVEHLRRRGVGAQRDRNMRVDEALLRQVVRTPATGNFDLLYGVVGVGVYALERLPHDNGARLLTAVVDWLAAAAERSPDGVTWLRRANWIPEPYRAAHPERSYNLGMAHGVPGVIAMLGLACGAGVAEPVARPLLRDAVHWLLAQRLDDGSFPERLVEGEEVKSPRSAWCHGDPGVAAALAVAGRYAAEPDWVGAAGDIALMAARRPEQQTRVVDACVCHGSAGLALMFGQLAAATDAEELGAVAGRWAERTMAFRRPGVGVAGFATREPDAEGRTLWVAHPGLLVGAAGVGLALQATAGSDPSWSRWLLVS